MKKIICRVRYPWACIPADECIMEVEDHMAEWAIEQMAQQIIEEMVWDRVNTSWEVIENA